MKYVLKWNVSQQSFQFPPESFMTTSALGYSRKQTSSQVTNFEFFICKFPRFKLFLKCFVTDIFL